MRKKGQIEIAIVVGIIAVILGGIIGYNLKSSGGGCSPCPDTGDCSACTQELNNYRTALSDSNEQRDCYRNALVEVSQSSRNILNSYAQSGGSLDIIWNQKIDDWNRAITRCDNLN